jgi:hypothetical protein
MPPELWSVLSGGTLLAAAVCWRWLSHRRVRTRLELALRSGNPVVRQAGIRVAVDQGLRPNAKLLLSCIDRESDPEVLSVLAESVLRNSWEPADHPAILRLRLWAYEEYARPERAGQPRVGRHRTTAAPTWLLAQHRSDGVPRHRATDTKSLRVVERIG